MENIKKNNNYFYIYGMILCNSTYLYALLMENCFFFYILTEIILIYINKINFQKANNI